MPVKSRGWPLKRLTILFISLIAFCSGCSGCAGKRYQTLVAKWGVASTVVLNETEALYRDASSVSRAESVALELSAFMSHAATIHKAAASNKPQDAADAREALQAAPSSIAQKVAQLSGPEATPYAASNVAIRLEYIKALREFVAAMLALATSKESGGAGDALFESIAAGGRIHLQSTSANKEELTDLNLQLLAGAASYATEKLFDAQKEKHLRDALKKAGGSIGNMLDEIERESNSIRTKRKTRAAQERDFWVAVLSVELWKQEQANPEVLVTAAQHWVALEKQLEAIARAEANEETSIRAFKKAHVELLKFAKGESSQLTWEGVNAELDRFLVRAKAAAEARKAYLEAVASRPDATPSDFQKLTKAALNKAYLEILSNFGVPVELLEE